MGESSSKRDFQWTDDEVDFLLHSTHLFKVKKEMECEDWEVAKTKVSREPIKNRSMQAESSLQRGTPLFSPDHARCHKRCHVAGLKRMRIHSLHER